jgi:hypothetical protein
LTALDLHYHRTGGPVKIRLIKETPQNDASSLPVSPDTLASGYRRPKKSWDEELAKFDPDLTTTPTSEKDSQEKK